MDETDINAAPHSLGGVAIHEDVHLHSREKQAIGKATAALRQPGGAVMSAVNWDFVARAAELI